MRSRAALLPYPGDPFLLTYWLHFFDVVWQDEVDKLYIFLNSPIEEDVVNYIRELCGKNPKIELLYADHQIEHGDVINALLDACQEELVMLVEDDGFIFKHGIVDSCFAAIESGEVDIVGSKRGSCSMEILTRAKQLWGLDYSGEGDQGCNFWPNFFFTKKQYLIETDRNFAAKTWKHGEVIEWLSTPGDTYYAQGELAVGDTFVNTSLQLQKRFPQNRIKYVPQYHGSPDDLEHYERGYNLFDGVAGWCHIGSLSSGVGGVLQDGKGRCLARRKIDPEKESGRLPLYATTDQERKEFERRVQWWSRFLDYFQTIGPIPPHMLDFALAYAGALERLQDEYELDRRRIDRRKRIYATLGL